MAARSSSAPRTLVIGDVHGCLDELRALVAAARLGADDQVGFVGDLVAKGPDSAGVVGWARERGAAAVMGNHDEHVLRALEGDHGAKEAHRRVAATLSKADAKWLAARPLWWRLADLDEPHVVVHGGMMA